MSDLKMATSLLFIKYWKLGGSTLHNIIRQACKHAWSSWQWSLERGAPGLVPLPRPPTPCMLANARIIQLLFDENCVEKISENASVCSKTDRDQKYYGKRLYYSWHLVNLMWIFVAAECLELYYDSIKFARAGLLPCLVPLPEVIDPVAVCNNIKVKWLKLEVSIWSLNCVLNGKKDCGFSIPIILQWFAWNFAAYWRHCAR